MARVRFEGEPGRELWSRVKDYLELIESDPPNIDLEGDERRDAEVRMVTFLVSAAFGQINRMERFWYLSNLNRDIYRILYSDEDVTAEIDTGTCTRHLYLGLAEGFTAVIPLTAEGFNAYMSNEVSPSELTEYHIVSYPYAMNSIPHVLLTGAVHFPAIFEKDRFAFNRNRLSRAARVINLLLDHIACYVPLIELYKDDKGTMRVASQGAYPLPTLVCYIPHVGMGEQLLDKAGFDFAGFDKRRNLRFVLNVSDVNDGAFDRSVISRDRLMALRNSVALLARTQRKRQSR